jgi:hypothetical protein
MYFLVSVISKMIIIIIIFLYQRNPCPKIAVFWVVAPCSLVGFIRAISLTMEAESTSETSVNSYQTARRNNPEDSHLHTRRHENLKSQINAQFNYCYEIILFPEIHTQF